VFYYYLVDIIHDIFSLYRIDIAFLSNLKRSIDTTLRSTERVSCFRFSFQQSFPFCALCKM